MSSSFDPNMYGFVPFDAGREFLHIVLPEFPPAMVDGLVPPGQTPDNLFPDSALLSDQITALREQLAHDSALLNGQITRARERLSSPPTAAELLQTRASNEAYEARRQRRVIAGGVAASAIGLAMGAGLIVSATNYARTQAEASEPSRVEPPIAEASVTPTSSSSSSSSSLPSYKEVLLHYVSFDGAAPIDDMGRRTDVAKTQGALNALNKAYKGHWDIGGLTVRAETTTYDLTVDGLSIRVACGKGGGADTTDDLSREVLTALDKQATLEPDVLDIVVMEVDEAVACRGIPVGEMSQGDVVVYQDGKITEAVLAHEMIHTTHYGHDNRYAVRLDGNTVRLDSETRWFPYGNAGTLPGDGARAEKVTDKDPLTGYHMLQAGVLASKQVATVPEGGAMDLKLSALTADDAGQPIKLVNLPLSSENRPNQADAIMLELSYEGDELSLKAYGAGTVVQNGIKFNHTLLVPLTADGRYGMGRDALNKPVIIDLGGEQISLTLHTLGSGDNATASVSVNRS